MNPRSAPATVLSAFFFLACATFARAESFTCPAEIAVYSAEDPSKPVGQFKAGSRIEVGKLSEFPGMYHVTFMAPDGKFIIGLCRDDDIAKAPATGSQAPPRPAPPQPAGGSFGNTEVFRNVQDDLIDAAGRSVSSRKLGSSKFVLVYFSAHWCPPCRAFTPELVRFYNENASKNLELVFVSSDRSGADMYSYMREANMPWPGIRYQSRAHQFLADKFSGPGIPCLVLLDDKGGILSHSYVNGHYAGPHEVLKNLRGRL